MNIIEEIKKDIKNFIQKNKEASLKLLHKITAPMKLVFVQVACQLWQAIKVIYLKYFHTTIKKYWRKLVYLWIVCKHYGKKFVNKLWIYCFRPSLKVILKYLKWIFEHFFEPVIIYLLDTFWLFVEQVYKMIKPILIWIYQNIVYSLFQMLKPLLKNYLRRLESLLIYLEKIVLSLVKLLSYFRDGVYVVLGFPIYIYKKIAKKFNN